MTLKLAHIINPVKVNQQSDLFIAQPVTFETMHRAKEFAGPEVEIKLYTAQYAEDKEIIPEFYIKTPDLTTSVMNLGQFEKKRKLPLIKDILDRLSTFAIDADYFIYTNVDIALQPHFYLAVKSFIEKGFDAFVINRRTIPKPSGTSISLENLYSHEGEPHPGADCFIFKSELFPNFKLGDACIGANFIGKVLNLNLQVFSKNYFWFKDEYLTFHLGDDRSWDCNEYSDYDFHNKSILDNIFNIFFQEGLISSGKIDDYYINKLIESKEESKKGKSNLLIKVIKRLGRIR